MTKSRFLILLFLSAMFISCSSGVSAYKKKPKKKKCDCPSWSYQKASPTQKTFNESLSTNALNLIFAI